MVPPAEPPLPPTWQLPQALEIATPSAAGRAEIDVQFDIVRPTAGSVAPLEPTLRVLVATGDTEPGNNRFDREVATIRQALELTAITVVPLPCADPTEITRHLPRVWPTVLHLSAHTAHGAIAFTVDGTVRWVDQEEVGKIITQAPQPRLPWPAVGRIRHPH